MLSIEQLRSLSLPQAFERGESLHAAGAVRKLIKVAKHFSAEVQGSFRYQLSIDLEHEPPYAACSCPYDGQGWCKHLVAAGIAIMHAAWTEEAFVAETAADETNFYEDVFLKAGGNDREAFLRQLFAQREEMKKAFRLFVEPPKVVSFKQVVDVRRRVGEEFEKRNVETISMEETEKTSVSDFIPGKNLLDMAAEEGGALKMTAALLGIVESGMILAKKHDGTIAEGVKAFCRDQIDYVRKYWKNQLLPLSENKSAIELIIDRWSFLRARNDEGAFSLSPFAPLLKTLASDEIPARYLLFRLEAFSVELSAEVPGLFVYAAKKADDKKAFERYAERFWKEDQDAAESFLLSLYKENQAEFYKKADEALDLFGKNISHFFVDKISKSGAPGLYQKNLLHRASKEHSTTLYEEWRGSATEDERAAFIDEQKEDEHFFLQLLIIEKKHEAIRLLAKDKEADQLLDYLSPILEVYPDFCFSSIRDALAGLLAKASGRSIYRLAAGLIRLARQIPGYREKANELHAQYDALGWPALSEELNKPQSGGWTIYADD
ncbi:MAG: hypothetical protein R3B47_19985 [Bacteroidia bacterium]